MHQLMAGLDDDGVLSRHLQPMMDKLQGMLGADDERGARADAPREGDLHRAAAHAQPPLRAAGQRAGATQARVAALLQAQRPQHERARGLAAAPGELPQHLVPRRLVPRERGPAPLCARRHSRGQAAGEQGAQRGGEGPGGRARRRLRHLRRRRRQAEVGDARVPGRRRAVGGGGRVARRSSRAAGSTTAATSCACPTPTRPSWRWTSCAMARASR